MRTITEVYNNIPCREGLTPDWGFSCYIHEAKPFFDTGAKGDGTVIEHACSGSACGYPEPALSHDPLGHTGGPGALAENSAMEVFVHRAFPRARA